MEPKSFRKLKGARETRNKINLIRPEFTDLKKYGDLKELRQSKQFRDWRIYGGFGESTKFVEPSDRESKNFTMSREHRPFI